MKKLYVLLLVFSLIVPSLLRAQEFTAGFQLGLGTYRMNELKEFNELITPSLPFEAHLIQSYPPFLYYKPGIYFSFGRFSTGLRISFNSTGSRISLKDYSGEYTFDTKVGCVEPGLFAGYSLGEIFRNAKISAFSEAGMCFSKLELIEKLIVDVDPVSDNSTVLKSTNFFVEPGIRLSYDLYPGLILELKTGYSVQFGKGYFISENNSALGHGDGDDPVGPDWSGLRIGVSVLLSPAGFGSAPK